MKRERTPSRVALTMERPPERMDDNVLRLTDRLRARREPSAYRSGLEGFLAALPRMFSMRAGNRAARAHEVLNEHVRSTYGDDAA